MLKFNDKSDLLSKTELTVEIVNLKILIWLISKWHLLWTQNVIRQSRYDTRTNIGTYELGAYLESYLDRHQNMPVTSLSPDYHFPAPATMLGDQGQWQFSNGLRVAPVIKPQRSCQNLQFASINQRDNSLITCRHVITLCLLHDLNSKK